MLILPYYAFVIITACIAPQHFKGGVTQLKKWRTLFAIALGINILAYLATSVVIENLPPDSSPFDGILIVFIWLPLFCVLPVYAIKWIIVELQQPNKLKAILRVAITCGTTIAFVALFNHIYFSDPSDHSSQLVPQSPVDSQRQSINR